MFYSFTMMFLFEFFYREPGLVDRVFWFLMLLGFAIMGIYLGASLHKQYFFFFWGEDFVEYILTIDDSCQKKATRLQKDDIAKVEKTEKHYIFTLTEDKPLKIRIKNLECLAGSEILKEKLDALVTNNIA
jgi:hypothetical protein